MDRLQVVKREPVSDEECGARAAPGKQAASPAQEATRAQIVHLEAQLRKLGGRLDGKGAYQMRVIEEELKKAHSKLKRLLNEAERQRRRRERLRSRAPPVPSPPPRDDRIMAALRSCMRFQDFVRELNVLGFTLTPHQEIDTDDTMPEVDGVKVQVELIEGDEELSADLKGNNDATLQDAMQSETAHEGGRWKEESYRQWYERQLELQQRWEEGFMREQMELARGLLDSVTATFLQGVQQVVASVTAGGRRPHFCQPPSP